MAADEFVAFGVEHRRRDAYKVWEERKAPDFGLEILSPNTFRNDLGSKRRRYQRMGVREYWTHDPSGELPTPRLAGWKLRENQAIWPDENSRMPSAA